MGHGSGRTSNGGSHPVNTGTGLIYPWVLPPIPFPTTEFMQCAGRDVVAGVAQDYVVAVCGAPTSTRQVVYTTQRGAEVIDVWSYARPRSVTRTLRFENGVLQSIDTVHAVNR